MSQYRDGRGRICNIINNHSVTTVINNNTVLKVLYVTIMNPFRDYILHAQIALNHQFVSRLWLKLKHESFLTLSVVEQLLVISLIFESGRISRRNGMK